MSEPWIKLNLKLALCLSFLVQIDSAWFYVLAMKRIAINTETVSCKSWLPDKLKKIFPLGHKFDIITKYTIKKTL